MRLKKGCLQFNLGEKEQKKKKEEKKKSWTRTLITTPFFQTRKGRDKLNTFTF